MGEIILAVGAHPDDIELGCGGTIKKKIAEGDTVYGLVLTKGENGNHCPEYKECKESAHLLGLAELYILDFKDGHINDDFSVVSIIEEYVKRIRPEILYTHSPNDRHQDHRNCSNAAKSAARRVPTLLLFESPSSTIDFSPHYFSDITNTLEDKIQALSKYKSQIKKGGLDLEWTRAQAYYWGSKNRKNGEKVYAEAFEVNHIIR